MKRKIEENIEESRDQDSFECDSDSTEEEVSGDNGSEMKRGWEFPSITSGQLHGSLTPFIVSPILSPSPSTPSLRPNASMSQGTLACHSSCASTSASKRGRGRTRGVGLEKSLRSRFGSRKLSVHILEEECGRVSSTAATLSTKIGMLDNFDLDYTHKEDMRTERMDAFQCQCDLEGKTYTEIDVYSEILGKKLRYVLGIGRAVKPPPSSSLTTQSSDLQHQLAKAWDESC
ncbi:hypothetical protein CJ030_MR0G013390 [Morella rubra]|uniref:Uncharacterized protein n=1 Tax=Morella rubra TaxID=262757 RepID=A0A6A1UI05_9ROSI|nr:hypothetical protein CJ030_MR0G013390 [Morella rubra]